LKKEGSKRERKKSKKVRGKGEMVIKKGNYTKFKRRRLDKDGRNVFISATMREREECLGTKQICKCVNIPEESGKDRSDPDEEADKELGDFRDEHASPEKKGTWKGPGSYGGRKDSDRERQCSNHKRKAVVKSQGQPQEQ
jgi:hypothetical protein